MGATFALSSAGARGSSWKLAGEEVGVLVFFVIIIDMYELS